MKKYTYLIILGIALFGIGIIVLVFQMNEMDYISKDITKRVNVFEFYDNKENSYIWDFDLNFYSSDPNLVNTKLLEAKKKLKEKGFIVRGKGYDVASDEPTHTGRGINVLKIEK